MSHLCRAVLKVLKGRSYLIKMDPILVRACLYLIPHDDLVECAGQVNVELLDMLVFVYNNTPTDIRSHSVTVKGSWALKWMFLSFKMEIEIWDLCFTDSFCCS